MARVLVVDDSPTELQAFKSMLEKQGHDVMVAENGAEGVAKARQELPDVVLMDIVMPGLNGFQATRQLNKDPTTTQIPVIIVYKDWRPIEFGAVVRGPNLVKTVPANDLLAEMG